MATESAPEPSAAHHVAEPVRDFTTHPDIFSTELTDDDTTARDQLLSPAEAADMLNIPLSALTKMMEEGHLPYEAQGSRIRVRADSVLAFQEALRTRRADALDRMQAQSQADNI